jgi:mono/diheme cytochrome c family protein
MSSRLGATLTIAGYALVVGSLSIAACAPTITGVTDADIARAGDQSSRGAAAFSQECARCHGRRGEGLAGASAILGRGALPEYPRDNSGSGTAMMTDPQQLQIQIQTRPAGAPWRDPFRNAQDLYDFVRVHLPKSRADALTQDVYWGIVTFMLTAQGSQLPPGGVNASSASAIPIPRR